MTDSSLHVISFFFFTKFPSSSTIFGSNFLFSVR